MAVTPEASDSGSVAASRPSFAETLAVYLKRRVLIVMLLGFSSGLPLALSGSTLAIWMTEVGVNLKTIGLFALVGTPYTIKFLWAPLIDALNVPLLSRWLGRRRGWLLLSQFLLIAAIIFVGVSDPAVSPLTVALGVLLVATTSATQDIVVDAFRVESLDESEQAAGMAAYVAGYRVGTLVSTAGALFLVSGLQTSRSRSPRRLARRLFRHEFIGTRRRRDHPCRNRAGEVHRGRSHAGAREHIAPCL